jgi:hypothetical protein
VEHVHPQCPVLGARGEDYASKRQQGKNQQQTHLQQISEPPAGTRIRVLDKRVIPSVQCNTD